MEIVTNKFDQQRENCNILMLCLQRPIVTEVYDNTFSCAVLKCG